MPTAKKTTKKAPAKKAAKKKELGECYAGDGRPGVGTVETAFGPRVVCERHAERARNAGRTVR